MRTLAEAAKIVTQKQTREKIDLYGELKAVIGGKRLKAAYQPVCRLSEGTVAGYEALIRGPQGSALEMPNALFAVARENDLHVELESLCLETIFSKLPSRVASHRLFVNASATLLRHPVFLNPRNLTAINQSHPDVVIEISEKEVVGDYASFRDTLEVLRGSNLKIAIDDAGSGYSGLETILYLRPAYIKVADSLVRNLKPIRLKVRSSRAPPRRTPPTPRPGPEAKADTDGERPPLLPRPDSDRDCPLPSPPLSLPSLPPRPPPPAYFRRSSSPPPLFLTSLPPSLRFSAAARIAALLPDGLADADRRDQLAHLPADAVAARARVRRLDARRSDRRLLALGRRRRRPARPPPRHDRDAARDDRRRPRARGA